MALGSLSDLLKKTTVASVRMMGKIGFEGTRSLHCRFQEPVQRRLVEQSMLIAGHEFRFLKSLYISSSMYSTHFFFAPLCAVPELAQTWLYS